MKSSLIKKSNIDLPVISVGNITLGGAGKTPVTIALCKIFAEMDIKAGVLLRGYGRKTKGTIKVNAAKHSFLDVGDEALLLANFAEVFIAKDKLAGAKRASKAGDDVLIVDDGLQSFALQYDLSILVIDGKYGFGNGLLFPAGPLREPLCRAMQRVDMIVLLGEANSNLQRFLEKTNKPIIRAKVTIANKLASKDIIAFSGLALNDKFFNSLREQKYNLIKTIEFKDHHHYKNDEIEKILSHKKKDVVIVTTEKDYVRIPEKYRAEIEILKIAVEFEDKDLLKKQLKKYVKKN